MRRLLIVLLLVTTCAALAGCGNKGPLVRPPAHAAAPAPPASAPVPAG